MFTANSAFSGSRWRGESRQAEALAAVYNGCLAATGDALADLQPHPLLHHPQQPGPGTPRGYGRGILKTQVTSNVK